VDLDPDPDPAIFVIDLQDVNKKTNKKSFSAYYFLKIHSFFKDKKSKRSYKTVRINVFLTILLDNRRMIEGSGRPKNMWIRWIRIRIRNTALGSLFYLLFLLQAHSFASTLLLNLLVKDRDLIGHLHSMKKYFLMEQGCGYVFFIY
jgi:hypothetical protein